MNLELFIFDKNFKPLEIVELEFQEQKQLIGKINLKSREYEQNVFMTYFDDFKTKNNMFFNNEKIDYDKFREISRDFALSISKLTREDLLKLFKK